MKRLFTAFIFFTIAFISLSSSASNAPQNFTATVTGSSVNFSWSSVPATAICDGDVPCTFSNYVLQQTGVTLGMYNGEGLRIDNRSTTSFSLNNLPVGQHEFYLGSYYTYYSDEYEFFPTQKITVTISSGVPQTPASISATLSGTSVIVNWGTAQSATSYELQRNTADLSTVSTTGYTDSSAAAGSTNSYRVRACNAAGCSSWTTNQAVVRIPLIPAAPDGVGGQPARSAMSVSWSYSYPGSTITRYELMRNSVPLTTLNSTSNAGGSYLDATATIGVAYTYGVRACNTTGCSAWTTSAAVTMPNVPAVPANITATPGISSMAISWAASTGTPIYELQRNSAVLYSTTATNHTDSGAAINTSYVYRVRACNATGCSIWATSSAAMVTIQRTDYIYDALGRLVGVRQNGAVKEGYRYDKAGNRCSVSTTEIKVDQNCP